MLGGPRRPGRGGRRVGAAAKADPAEPGGIVQVVVAVVAMPGPQQHPVVAVDGEVVVVLGDGQCPGLHHDQLVDGEHPVHVAALQPGRVHARLDDWWWLVAGPLTHAFTLGRGRSESYPSWSEHALLSSGRAAYVRWDESESA